MTARDSIAWLSAEQMPDIERSRARFAARDIEPIVGVRHAMKLESSRDAPELESHTFNDDSP